MAGGAASGGSVSGSDFAKDLVGRDLEGRGRSVGRRLDRTTVSWSDLWWWCRGGSVAAALDVLALTLMGAGQLGVWLGYL